MSCVAISNRASDVLSQAIARVRTYAGLPRGIHFAVLRRHCLTHQAVTLRRAHGGYVACTTKKPRYGNGI